VVDKQDEENPVQERIRAALQSDIPNINFNGMITSLGTGDVLILLERNGQSVAVLNASYTVAKTLSVLLGNSIAQLEELSKHPIMTTMEVERFLAAKKPKDSVSTDAKRQKKANANH
jgi:hypothetical protein